MGCQNTGAGYMVWLAVLSLAFLYNAFSIPLRVAYPYQTNDNLIVWLAFDYVCDLFYLIDIIFVKPRIEFMQNGLPVVSSSIKLHP